MCSLHFLFLNLCRSPLQQQCLKKKHKQILLVALRVDFPLKLLNLSLTWFQITSDISSKTISFPRVQKVIEQRAVMPLAADAKQRSFPIPSSLLFLICIILTRSHVWNISGTKATTFVVAVNLYTYGRLAFCWYWDVFTNLLQ